MNRAVLALALVLGTSATARDDLAVARHGEGALSLDERAGSGTLPLRLRGGEGTLPLRFEGQAVVLGSSRTIDATLVLSTVTQQAMAPQQGAGLSCQMRGERVSKHAASGDLAVAGIPYAIRGICYDHDNQSMEIVGTSGGNQSFLVSRLPSPAPRALSGRLTVQEAGGGGGRYSVNMRSHDPDPR